MDLNPPTLHTPRLLLHPPLDYDDDRFRRELIERDEDDTVMAIVHHDAVIGTIQFGEEADPQYRHASRPRLREGGLPPRGRDATLRARRRRHLASAM